METLFLVNKLFALGVIAGDVSILLILIYAAFFRKKYPLIAKFIGAKGFLFAFAISLISMLGSLYYSQIAGFPPCELCWFQRIFMYPLVFLLGFALLKKDSRIVDYVLTLSIIGGIISLYHNYMYYMNGGLSAYCQVAGQGVSCIRRYVFELGYVTIPIMALTSFVLIIIFLAFAKNQKNI